MTEKEYRQHPAISRSELWRMHESPEKFKYYRDNPPEPTPALLFGQVVHKLLLQPEDFDSEFVVAPEIDRRTKAGKEKWSEFLDHIGQQQVITQEMYGQAREMVSKALSYPEIYDLLEGEHEKPYFWNEEETGEPCKCRVDSINSKSRFIVDYKTTGNASTEAFMGSIEKYGYAFQAAMYLYGARAYADSFIFIAQEKNPPYSVNIIPVDEDMRKRGLETYRELIHQYSYCKATGDWFGPMGPRDINLYQAMMRKEKIQGLTEKLPWE